MTEVRHAITGLWRRFGRPDLGGLPPTPPSAGPTASAGSLPVGEASYPVPTGALFVDPGTGTDTASGSINAPLKTIRAAVAKVSTNGTIVLRGGVYYEGSVSSDPQPAYGITLSGTNKVGVTIQNYPGEAAWMDGSPPVTTPWTQEGAYWSTPYVRTFDRTPANVRGQKDDPGNLGPAWQWVNPKYPCAPWPDMVFYDGVQLTQVPNKTDLGPGKFWVEGTLKGGTGTDAYVFTSTTLYVGSDPAGHEVCATTYRKALLVIATDVTFRGFGVRRYADSIPDTEQVVHCVRDRFTVENMVIEDCAMAGLGLTYGSNMTLRKVTVQRCGSRGGGAYQCDNMLIDSCRFVNNNYHHFHYAPASGGWKVTQSRAMKFVNCAWVDNYCHGLWFDMSNHTPLVLTCDMTGNWGSGVIVEISAWAVIADCLVANNGIGDERALDRVFDLNIDSSDGTRLWNNTVANQGFNVTFNDSGRRYSGPGYPNYGRDGRNYPDPTMTWDIQSGEMRNSVISGSGASGTWLWALNGGTNLWTHFGYTGGGNLWNRKAPNLPSWLFVLQNRQPTSIIFNLASLQSTTGQEAGSGFVDGVNALNADYSLKTAYANAATPVPLPADIAAMLNRPAGTTHLGCWR